MTKKRMSNSIRKYIRKEKARIRREILGIKEQEESIIKLYEKLGFKNQEIKEVKNK